MTSRTLLPPWPERAPQQRLMAALERPEAFVPTRQEQGAFALLRQLPEALAAALLAELRHGNAVVQVDQPDWPQAGSLFITVRERFHPSSHALCGPVHWRDVNDPHYWREELTQRCGDVEHLIVC